MYAFMFIVVLAALFLSNPVDALDDGLCNTTLFPHASTEIHAMLARDRYINFTGWISTLNPYNFYHRLNKSGGTEDISYGYLKEMVLHLNSISEEGRIDARVFLTSGENKLVYMHNINVDEFSDYQLKFRERFLRFKLFTDGIIIEHIYITQNGVQETNPMRAIRFPFSGTAYANNVCHSYYFPEQYTIEDYSKVDGLLIEINCKTTNVKKILVKVHPK